MTELRFIAVPGAVSDAGELLRGLAYEARALGAEVEVTESWEGEGVSIFAPGDAFGVPQAPRPPRRQLRRSIAVCEDAPTGPLDVAYLNARRCAGAITPDAAGATALRGVAMDQIALGGSDAWLPERDTERTVDVLCLARRGIFADRYLASFGQTLWRRRSWLLGPPEVPTGAEKNTVPSLPLGEERRRLLSCSRVVLLGLGEEGPEVERLRALQAVAANTVIVAPHDLDLAPLAAGRDYAVAEPRNLAAVADALLEEPGEMERLCAGSAGTLQKAAGLSAAAEKLLGLAERVGGGRVQPGAAATRAGAKSALSRTRNALRSTLRPPPNPSRVAAKRKALEEIVARRDEAARAAGVEDPTRAKVLHTTPAYEGAQPRISVCIPVYEHASPLRRALASACGSGREDVEILILDDGSAPDTVAQTRALIEEIPWMPAVLLGRRANRGLGPGRTEMAERARGELLFMLDADNDVYPNAFDRLAAALDDDPNAAFAYSLIEAHTENRPRGLLSLSPWDPLRLRRGNYIDAMSMIRRSALLDAGGYTDDIRLHGWEDFDLWCRFAALGRRGLLVPEVLCRYSLSEASMISVTNLDSSDAWEHLCRLHPDVLGGAPLPTYDPPPPDEPL